MKKKLIPLTLVIGVVAAFAVPSFAAAAPVLTQPTGTVVPAGTALVATNFGESEFTTSFGNITCTSAIAKGVVASNSTASGVRGEVTSVTFSGTGPGADCTSWAGGSPSHPTLVPTACLGASKRLPLLTKEKSAVAVAAAKPDLSVLPWISQTPWSEPVSISVLRPRSAP